jgi:hypothetical protein
MHVLCAEVFPPHPAADEETGSKLERQGAWRCERWGTTLRPRFAEINPTLQSIRRARSAAAHGVRACK